jgi:GWxTD domain-containing protein
MKHVIRFAVATLVALPLLAADLGKYNDWDQSPQGYFMTKAEREQWEQVDTAAAAEKFVAEFLAKRDPKFPAEVAERAAQADKHLTVGKTPGSKSIRGKAIVLFGPPSGLAISERSKSSTKRDNPVMAGVLSNTGSGGGGSRMGDDSTSSLGTSISTSQMIRTYSITFSGDATKKTVDKESVMFVIDVDPASGKDEFSSRSAGKAAEEMFELVARASIKK